MKNFENQVAMTARMINEGKSPWEIIATFKSRFAAQGKDVSEDFIVKRCKIFAYDADKR